MINPDRNYFQSSDEEDQETEDSQSDSPPSREMAGLGRNNSSNAKRQTSNSSSTGSVSYSKPLSLSNLCSSQRKVALNGPDDDTCFTIKLDNKINMQFKNDFKTNPLDNTPHGIKNQLLTRIPGGGFSQAKWNASQCNIIAAKPLPNENDTLLAYVINVKGKNTIKVCKHSAHQTVKTVIKGFPKDIIEIKWSMEEIDFLAVMDQIGMVYVYQIIHTKSSMEHKEVASFACGDGKEVDASVSNNSVNNITGRLMIYDYVKTFLLISFKNFVHILNLNDLHSDFNSSTNFKFHEPDKIWLNDLEEPIIDTMVSTIQLDIDETNIMDICLAPTGEYLAVADSLGGVSFWQLDEPKKAFEYEPYKTEQTGVSFISFIDGVVDQGAIEEFEPTMWKYLVTVDTNYSDIRLWHTGSWECLHSIKIINNSVHKLKFNYEPRANCLLIWDTVDKLFYMLRLKEETHEQDDCVMTDYESHFSYMYIYHPLHETKAVTIPSIDNNGKLKYFYMTCVEVHEAIANLPNFSYCPSLVASGSDSLLNSLHQNFSSMNQMEPLAEASQEEDEIDEENGNRMKISQNGDQNGHQNGHINETGESDKNDDGESQNSEDDDDILAETSTMNNIASKLLTKSKDTNDEKTVEEKHLENDNNSESENGSVPPLVDGNDDDISDPEFDQKQFKQHEFERVEPEEEFFHEQTQSNQLLNLLGLRKNQSGVVQPNKGLADVSGLVSPPGVATKMEAITDSERDDKSENDKSESDMTFQEKLNKINNGPMPNLLTQLFQKMENESEIMIEQPSKPMSLAELESSMVTEQLPYKPKFETEIEVQKSSSITDLLLNKNKLLIQAAASDSQDLTEITKINQSNMNNDIYSDEHLSSPTIVTDHECVILTGQNKDPCFSRLPWRVFSGNQNHQEQVMDFLDVIDQSTCEAPRVVILFLSDPALEKCIGDNWRQFNTEIVQYFLKKDRFREGVINLVLASYDNSVYNAAISKFCTKNLISQLKLGQNNICEQIKEYLALSNQNTTQDDNESDIVSDDEQHKDSDQKSEETENSLKLGESDSEIEYLEKEETIEQNTQDEAEKETSNSLANNYLGQNNSLNNNTMELLSEQLINARPASNSFQNSVHSSAAMASNRNTPGQGRDPVLSELEKLTQKVDSLNLRVLQLSQQSNNPNATKNQSNSYHLQNDEKVTLHPTSVNEVVKGVEKSTYAGIQGNFQQMARDLSYMLTNPHSQVVTDLSKTIQLQVAGGLNKTQAFFGQEWAKKMDASIHKFLEYHHRQFFEQFDREMTSRCQNISANMNKNLETSLRQVYEKAHQESATISENINSLIYRGIEASIQKAFLQIQPHWNNKFNDFTNKTQDVFELGSQQYINKLESHLGEQYRRVTERSLSVCDQMKIHYEATFSKTNIEKIVDESVSRHVQTLETSIQQKVDLKLESFTDKILKQQSVMQQLILDQQKQLDLVLRQCSQASENAKMAASFAQSAKIEAMAARDEATGARSEAQGARTEAHSARTEANYARSEVARSEVNVSRMRQGTSMTSLVSVEDQERALKNEVKQFLAGKKFNQAFTKILCESVNSEMNSSGLLTWLISAVKVEDVFSRESKKSKSFERLEQDVILSLLSQLTTGLKPWNTQRFRWMRETIQAIDTTKSDTCENLVEYDILQTLLETLQRYHTSTAYDASYESDINLLNLLASGLLTIANQQSQASKIANSSSSDRKQQSNLKSKSSSVQNSYKNSSQHRGSTASSKSKK